MGPSLPPARRSVLHRSEKACGAMHAVFCPRIGLCRAQQCENMPNCLTSGSAATTWLRRVSLGVEGLTLAQQGSTLLPEDIVPRVTVSRTLLVFEENKQRDKFKHTDGKQRQPQVRCRLQGRGRVWHWSEHGPTWRKAVPLSLRRQTVVPSPSAG